jgi:hypothetical protein
MVDNIITATVFWDMTPCSMVDIYKDSQQTSCFPLESRAALAMEIVHSYETSMNYVTTWQSLSIFIPQEHIMIST